MIEIVLGVVLSLGVGVALAVVYLLVKPVEVVKEMPAPDKVEEGMVYYLPGEMDSGKARQIWRKQQLFIEGQSVALNEDELNAWIAANNPQPPPDKDKKKNSDESLTPSQINFHLHENVMQIGFPATINLIGFPVQLIVQARGGFDRRGDAFVFAPDEFYIGSLPTHRLPVLTSILMKKILGTQQMPENLTAAWKKLQGVKVASSQLVLTMPK